MALVQRLTRSTKDQYIIPESLTHNTGVITATVNGVNYTCTLSGLTANTLYFLYLRPGQANIQFVTTTPSSYRASFPQAILIGAFYSNNLSPISFGAFVTIEGTPQTEWWTTNNSVGPALSSTGTLPTFGTMSHNLYRLKRIGDTVYGQWVMRQTAQGTAGTGVYIIVHPFPILDSQYRTNQAVTNQGYVFGSLRNQELAPGTWRSENPLYLPANITDGFAVALGMVGAGSNSTIGGDWGPIMPFGGSGQQLAIGIDYNYRVSGWSNTPLKDL